MKLQTSVLIDVMKTIGRALDCNWQTNSEKREPSQMHEIIDSFVDQQITHSILIAHFVKIIRLLINISYSATPRIRSHHTKIQNTKNFDDKHNK